MSHIRREFDRLAPGRVGEIARAALGEPDAELGAWDAVPLKGEDGGLLGARVLWLLRGVARVGAEERTWSVVLKVLSAVGGNDDPAHIDYWRRECDLVRSGILDTLPPGLHAPRTYGHDEPAEGTVWLWLEHIEEEGTHRWPLTRWALAARHMGQMNGAYLAGTPPPRASWLGGKRLRTWVERHAPLVTRIAAAPDNPAVYHWWPRPVVDGVLRLWSERSMFCDALERLPQTFCHGDAIRRNLFARRAPDGAEETVAIDWEYAGYYAAGEEVGQTLSVASAFYDLEPAALPELDEALFAGYLDGLRYAGWRGDPGRVRFAYTAHAALRNAFNAVGASVPDDRQRAAAHRTYGRTWEELAERRAELRPFLLARADEARRLLPLR